jgi:ElaB/YqjD/DUF883 family membrane-anchored ribosome-binding protein
MTTSKIEQGEVEPQTVGEARDAVERSRERISRTLDKLEDRIVEKKHELQEKADVFRPVKTQVRHRPLTAVAVAVGVGALLGSIGGGAARSRRRQRGKSQILSDDERRELREWRQQRRERLHALARGDEPSSRRASRRGSRLGNLKGQLIGAATSALTAAITSRVKDFARGSSGRREPERDRDTAWR